MVPPVELNKAELTNRATPATPGPQKVYSHRDTFNFLSNVSIQNNTEEWESGTFFFTAPIIDRVHMTDAFADPEMHYIYIEEIISEMRPLMPLGKINNDRPPTVHILVFDTRFPDPEDGALFASTVEFKSDGLYTARCDPRYMIGKRDRHSGELIRAFLAFENCHMLPGSEILAIHNIVHTTRCGDFRDESTLKHEGSLIEVGSFLPSIEGFINSKMPVADRYLKNKDFRLQLENDPDLNAFRSKENRVVDLVSGKKFGLNRLRRAPSFRVPRSVVDLGRPLEDLNRPRISRNLSMTAPRRRLRSKRVSNDDQALERNRRTERIDGEDFTPRSAAFIRALQEKLRLAQANEDAFEDGSDTQSTHPRNPHLPLR